MMGSKYHRFLADRRVGPPRAGLAGVRSFCGGIGPTCLGPLPVRRGVPRRSGGGRYTDMRTSAGVIVAILLGVLARRACCQLAGPRTMEVTLGQRKDLSLGGGDSTVAQQKIAAVHQGSAGHALVQSARGAIEIDTRGAIIRRVTLPLGAGGNVVSGVAGCGDGQVMELSTAGQLYVFAAGGAPPAHAQWPDSLGGAGFALFGCVGGNAVGGWVLPSSPVTAANGLTLVDNTLEVIVATPSGQLVRHLASVPSVQTVDGLVRPFGPTAVVAVNANRVAIARTDQTNVTVRSGPAFTATAISMTGLLAHDVTVADREAWIHALSVRTPAAIFEGKLRPILTALSWPSHAPLWDRLLLDDRGRAWVRAYLMPADSGGETWRAYGSAARTPAVLKLAPGERLLSIDHGNAWIASSTTNGRDRLQIVALQNWP